MKLSRAVLVCAVSAMVLGVASPAGATHQWGNRHWKKTSSGQVIIKLLDSTISHWRQNITPVAANDWSASSKHRVDQVTSGVSNDDSTRQNCPMPNRYRRVRVCNYPYGASAWDGQASVARNSNTGHIYYARLKIDTAGSDNSTDTERKQTVCHELGHALGLDHQNVNDSCLQSGGTHPHPNTHDINKAEDITHLHSSGDSSSLYDPSWLDDAIDVEADPCATAVCVTETSSDHDGITIDTLSFFNTQPAIERVVSLRLF